MAEAKYIGGQRICDLTARERLDFITDHKIRTTFENGGYTLTDGVLAENNAAWWVTNAARTGILKIPAYSQFIVTSDAIQGFVYISYDGETYTSYNWVTSTDKKFMPTQDCFVAAYFRAKSGTRPTLEEIANAFYIQPPFNTSDYPNLVLKNFELLSSKKATFSGHFVISGLSAAGAFTVNARNRIVFTDLYTFPVNVTLEIKDGFKIDVHTYINGEHASNSGWVGGSYTVPAGTTFRFLVLRSVVKEETDTNWWLEFAEAVTAEAAEDETAVINIASDKSFMFSARPKFMLHRGLQSQAPENSAPAFRLAGQAEAWGIETDVYETSDGKFVCIHDDTVDRTTNGTGNVRNLTLDEIEALTIDTGTNIGQYPNLKIPTFEEYLSICKTYGCVAFIEIKGVDNLQLLYDTVVKYGMLYQSVFTVWESLLIRMRAVDVNAIVPCMVNGYASASSYADVINAVKEYPNTLVALQTGTLLTDDVINLAHSVNIPVAAWTVDNLSSAIDYFERGIDIVTTNSLTSLTD